MFAYINPVHIEHLAEISNEQKGKIIKVYVEMPKCYVYVMK